MVPLLFLVVTTTSPNSSSNSNHTQEDTTSHSHHILPTMLVLSLLLLVIALLAWYFLRLKGQKKPVVTAVDKKILNGILEEQEQQTVVLLPRSPSAPKTYLPIPVDHLEEEYRLRSADDGKLFREEYNSLPGANAHGTYEEANKDDNKEKNRYPNILPYDHSRVALTQLDGNPCSDYVNASYIDGYTEKNKFIAAQGPKEDTVADFWRMIWEQKVATVVMLTNLRCSTHSSTRLCSNTTSMETLSLMCHLWRDICTNCTTPSQRVTGLALDAGLRVAHTRWSQS